jgi:uncharacterized protein YeaO (DUF488 family)/uncharacterized coiled-coil protein SlyX
MLYLNSIENVEASPTEKKYAICHEEIPSMLNIPELAPSSELLARWQSQEISWEEFREQFFEEMRTEYSNGEMSRLKGLKKYCLENDVTLHSPEPSGEQAYRTILEGIINAIWKSEGRTDRVINLAREPIEESQLIEGDSQQTSIIAQEEIANLVLQKILPEMTSARDDEILLIKENTELKARIDRLEGEINTRKTTIDTLRRTLSEKEEIVSNQRHEIQSLNDVIGERNKEQDGLNGRNSELEGQINTHKTTIGDLHRTLSKKEETISNQLQNINTYSKIRDIAVKAAGNDLEFKTLKIDEYLPISREEWLETRLNRALSRRNVGLYNLIDNHIDFDEELNPDELDYSDYDLAHVIKTQRNVLAHPEKMKKETSMARVFCCFFAAALLSPKRPKPEQSAFR